MNYRRSYRSPNAPYKRCEDSYSGEVTENVEEHYKGGESLKYQKKRKDSIISLTRTGQMLWLLVRFSIFLAILVFLLHAASCGLFFCYRIPPNWFPEQLFTSDYLTVTTSPLSNIRSKFSSPYYHTSLLSRTSLGTKQNEFADGANGDSVEVEPIPKIVHQTYKDVIHTARKPMEHTYRTARAPTSGAANWVKLDW